MTLSDIIPLLIGIIAAIVAYIFLRRIWILLSKDKQKSSRVIESVSAGLLATILFVIFQKYMDSVQSIQPIDFKSGMLFFKSLFIAIGNLFISTTIMLAVAFFAIYMILKPIMNKQGQK